MSKESDTADRGCFTCKHGSVDVVDEPCASCAGLRRPPLPNWEPERNDDLDKLIDSFDAPEPLEKEIREVCDALADFLVEKNRTYGNSAAEPVNVFAKGFSPTAQIDVRIDDKLSRLMRGSEDPGDDTAKDLLGDLVLRMVVTGGVEVNLPEWTNDLPDHATLNVRDLLSVLGVGEAMLYRWVKSGKFPEPDRRVHGRGIGGNSRLICEHRNNWSLKTLRAFEVPE